MLTGKQHQLLSYLIDYQAEKDITPSFDEMRAAIVWPVNQAYTGLSLHWKNAAISANYQTGLAKLKSYAIQGADRRPIRLAQM